MKAATPVGRGKNPLWESASTMPKLKQGYVEEK
jgi:hypothetical protein